MATAKQCYDALVPKGTTFELVALHLVAAARAIAYEGTGVDNHEKRFALAKAIFVDRQQVTRDYFALVMSHPDMVDTLPEGPTSEQVKAVVDGCLDVMANMVAI